MGTISHAPFARPAARRLNTTAAAIAHPAVVAPSETATTGCQTRLPATANPTAAMTRIDSTPSTRSISTEAKAAAPVTPWRVSA